jgi:hypothetical protein
MNSAVRRKSLLLKFAFFKTEEKARRNEMAEASLIAYGWLNLAQVCSFALFLSAALMLGYLSRKLEDAVAFMFLITTPVFLLYLLSIFI